MSGNCDIPWEPLTAWLKPTGERLCEPSSEGWKMTEGETPNPLMPRIPADHVCMTLYERCHV